MARSIAVRAATLKGSVSSQTTRIQCVVGRTADWAARRGSTDICWMTKLPAVKALSGFWNILPDFDLFEADEDEIREYPALKGQACKMYGSLAFSSFSGKVLYAGHGQSLRSALLEETGFNFTWMIEFGVGD